MEQDPRKILREEPVSVSESFEDHYRSPARDLALIRSYRKRNIDPTRMIRLTNKKWRLVYGMRYDKGK